MLNPQMLCRQHLVGQHLECHMVLGILNKKLNVDGYVQSNCLEIPSIQSYHDDCVIEMLKRNYNHNSPIQSINPNILQYYNKYVNILVDRQKSLNLLLSRCSLCRQNYIKLI